MHPLEDDPLSTDYTRLRPGFECLMGRINGLIEFAFGRFGHQVDQRPCRLVEVNQRLLAQSGTYGIPDFQPFVGGAVDKLSSDVVLCLASIGSSPFPFRADLVRGFLAKRGITRCSGCRLSSGGG